MTAKWPRQEPKNRKWRIVNNYRRKRERLASAIWQRNQSCSNLGLKLFEDCLIPKWTIVDNWWLLRIIENCWGWQQLLISPLAWPPSASPGMCADNKVYIGYIYVVFLTPLTLIRIFVDYDFYFFNSIFVLLTLRHCAPTFAHSRLKVSLSQLDELKIKQNHQLLSTKHAQNTFTY